MSDLKAKVLDWLQNKTGYPLELRIGKQFEKAGWSVNYSRWYKDVISDKNRELDVQAIAGSVIEGASIFVSLCIDCKTSNAKPWVGLSSGLTVGKQGSLSFAIGSLSRMTLIGAVTEGVELPSVVPPGTLRVGGVVQAFTKAQEEGSATSPYAALLQARSAALALDREYRAVALEVSGELKTAAIFLPVVIVDGPLFSYSVSQEIDDTLQPIEAFVASVPGEGESEAAAVPVLSRGYAEQHCASLLSSARNFCGAMLPHLSKVVGAIKIGDLTEEDGLGATQR